MKLNEVPRHYDRAAPVYDWLTRMVFGRWLRIERYRETMIDLLGNLDGATVLDIGCGTGRNFPLLVRRVGQRGRVIGLDYSPGMLQQARRQIERRGWRNVELLHGDAVKLDGVPEHVDGIVSAWCLGIVHDLEAALERALAVLGPGGRIAILDFQRTYPDRGALRWLYPVYSRLLRLVGIDSAEDLDNAQLAAKWSRGCELLRARLCHVQESTYLRGMGLVIAGQKPKGQQAVEVSADRSGLAAR